MTKKHLPKCFSKCPDCRSFLAHLLQMSWRSWPRKEDGTLELVFSTSTLLNILIKTVSKSCLIKLWDLEFTTDKFNVFRNYISQAEKTKISVINICQHVKETRKHKGLLTFCNLCLSKNSSDTNFRNIRIYRLI